MEKKKIPHHFLVWCILLSLQTLKLEHM